MWISSTTISRGQSRTLSLVLDCSSMVASIFVLKLSNDSEHLSLISTFCRSLIFVLSPDVSQSSYHNRHLPHHNNLNNFTSSSFYLPLANIEEESFHCQNKGSRKSKQILRPISQSKFLL